MAITSFKKFIIHFKIIHNLFQKSAKKNTEFLSLLLLDVFHEEVQGGSLLAPVPDNHGGAPYNLPLIALGIQLAKASVLAQLHVVGYSQEGNLMFLA